MIPDVAAADDPVVPAAEAETVADDPAAEAETVADVLVAEAVTAGAADPFVARSGLTNRRSGRVNDGCRRPAPSWEAQVHPDVLPPPG